MGKKEMKRYDLKSENYGYCSTYYDDPIKFETPDGEWVKWEDVQELVDTLKDVRLLVASVCREEYKAYYVTLHKIDNVLNKIEGKPNE